jgi:hypothetical protein
MVAGIVAGISAARATLVRATIDTVASKNFFIIPTPISTRQATESQAFSLPHLFSLRVT